MPEQQTITGSCEIVTVDKRELDLLHKLREYVADYGSWNDSGHYLDRSIRETLDALEAWKP